MPGTTHSRPSTNIKVTIPKGGSLSLGLVPQNAVVLYPALGNPAIARKKEAGSGWTTRLSLIILCQTNTLTTDVAAQHLKVSPWADKDKGRTVTTKDIQRLYDTDNASVTLSACYDASPDILGLGLKGPDHGDGTHEVRLSHLSVFPWILKSLKDYKYLYKITLDLKDWPEGMYNIWWVNAADYHTVKERPSWWNFVRHTKDFFTGEDEFPRTFKMELKEFGADVVDMSNNPKKMNLDENIRASIYHPFFVTTKTDFSIGHVTDIHLDSRMEVYGQCEASVIEVKDNCPPAAHGKKRGVPCNSYHSPIKDRIANFNQIFTNICEKLIEKKADAIVITGDLVDYNRGLHSIQTHRTCFTPVSKVWEALGSDVTEDTWYQDDRNWFLFYRKLLELYDRPDAVPIFTMLGNHDYVNYGMAPWPTILGSVPWNGVFDQNLTLYESALCFGEGYNSGKAFTKDIDERTDHVEWYTIFINPFMDYVVNLGDLSLLMVDWGVESNVIGPGVKTKVEGTVPGYHGAGGLHQADNLFKEDSNFKNFSIYTSFIEQQHKVKILFMHATGLCPRDDISIGQINFDLPWNDNRMKYGSFDKKHAEIIGDVESGKLNMIVAGHSHRNVVMVLEGRKGYASVAGAGEDYTPVTRKASHVVMVTSSGGPLPKYLPGGPMICACQDKYPDGWDTRGGFFRYKADHDREPLGTVSEENWRCSECGRHARDMAPKMPKRHRPGGSLLVFEKTAPGAGSGPSETRVSIHSVPSTLPCCKPRGGVLADEQGILAQGMKLEGIDNIDDFKAWDKVDAIYMISREPFDVHGYMEFPEKVEYVTFIKGKLDSRPYTVSVDRVDGQPSGTSDCKRVVRQGIGKDNFQYFMIAACDDEDFAFARYTFKDSKDTWDREITINKKKELVMKSFSGTPGSEPKDPFRSLVISFLRKPDFKKRRTVCGY